MAFDEFTTKISVEFDHPDQVYIGGEDLNGTVVINSNYPVKVTKLFVILNGETKVEWTHDNGLQKFGDYKQNIHVKHDLTKTLENLIAEDSQLFEGNCSVPFHFKLPENLPSSVESTFGGTKYVCKVEILDILHSPAHEHHHHHQQQHEERPQVFEFPFTVLAKILGKKNFKRASKGI